MDSLSSRSIDTGTGLDAEPCCWHSAADQEMVWRDADKLNWLKRLRGYSVEASQASDVIRLTRNSQWWIPSLILSCLAILFPAFAGYSAAKFNWSIAFDVLVWVVLPIVLVVLIQQFATGELPRKVLLFARDSQAVIYRGIFSPNSFCLLIREPKGDHLVFFGYVSRQAHWASARRLLEVMAPVIPISPDVVFVAGTPFSRSHAELAQGVSQSFDR
ncbi:MAG: hypothetical protein IT432_16045 [Phycisphaerales bacterium]|nr:hypothetical protein [Phycisphaerales bacterium]